MGIASSRFCENKMEICIICQNFIRGSGTKLGPVGCEKINIISSNSGNNVKANVGDKVHEDCRKRYVSKNHVASRFNSTEATDSNKHDFDFDTCCMFCGEEAKINVKKKDSGVGSIITSEDFLESIQSAIKKRHDDEWAVEVYDRINSFTDMVGVGVVFHNNCRIGFRTNKPKPKSKNSKSSHVEYREGFLDIVYLIQNTEQQQYSIRELIDKMNVISNGNAYSFNQMKANLLKHFGDDIIISTIQNKKTLVTLRKTCYHILDAFYESSRNEKEQIIEKASDIIVNDMKTVTPNKDFYPSTTDISLSEALKFLPESLLSLLRRIITGEKASLKIAFIGQAIVQTSYRENVMAPLQIALGAQMYHVTGSKFTVNTLYRTAFSMTYKEVKKFQLCASIALHEELSKKSSKDLLAVKYVADNVDHNLRTLDGKNTFHGMGIISIHEPLTETCSKIPRINANLKDVKEMGTVDIIPYFETMMPATSLLYRKLNPTEIRDPYNDLDLLWKMSWSEDKTRPSWSGMMQLVQHGSYPKKAQVNFLPIIDMNPNDLTCINSTLLFVCKDAARFNATPLLTFDQPLYWKARTIIENEAASSPIRRVVLMLGGFHLKMSFLGTIGHIMSGSGFDVTLAQVYAENSVIYMLTGKAYARAIRGCFMVDSALNSIIFEEILKDEELSQKVGDLYERVMNGSQDVDELQSNEVLKQIGLSFSNRKENLRNDATSRLWLQYMDLIDILKSNIRGDRTGNFKLHLETIQCMLPFLAASGHTLYVKSAHIYLQDMRTLEANNPSIFAFLSNGNFITRRTDRFWAGLPDDLIIEQMLMRGLKTLGGLTRGRGMDDMKRSLWLFSLPARAQINNAIQNLTDLKIETSEQHKECGDSRVIRDNKDTDCIYNFLKERNPFVGTTPDALRNIADGIISTSKANVHLAKKIGQKILQSLEDKNVYTFSFERCKQVVQMTSKNHISINGEMVSIEPDILFQRLLLLIHQTDRTEEEKEEMFCYELCHRAPSLFDSNGLMREANSSTLIKNLVTKISGMIDFNTDVDKLPNMIYELEGDWVIDKIQWQKGESFDDICERYITYLRLKFKKATIIFASDEGPSTKDESWLRNTKGIIGMEVVFSSDMSLKMKKEDFLRNKKNKQRFVELLAKKLEDNDFTVCIAASEDVVVKIKDVAVGYSEIHNIIVIGKQVNLLMVLCFYAVPDNFPIFYMYEETSKKPLQVFNITEMKKGLGEVKSKHLMFAHVMGGCEETSQFFGIGKALLFTKLDDANFTNQAEIFCCPNSSKEAIIKAGNEAIVSLYNGKPTDTLNKLRYRKYVDKTKRGTPLTCKSLPPTEAAAKYHSLRVYHQMQILMQNKLSPMNYGWFEKDTILKPVSTKLPPAPAHILSNIRCGCKGDCNSTRCTCFQNGLTCTTACKTCKGNSCSNRSPADSDTESDEDD